MKRVVIKFILVISLLTQGPFAYAQFSDVSPTHQNSQAIEYLQNAKIINGYNDGTFKPDNLVNRVEFLKIILEGSHIPLDKNENTILPFTDTEDSAWYAPYLRKAYAEGIIVGYPDGTFKPAQTINKAEALKILGEVQAWDTSSPVLDSPFKDTPKLAWYTKYVNYAQQHNYLEETGEYFSPDSLMTRAQISEVIYRTLIDEDNPSLTPTSTENSEQPETPEDTSQENTTSPTTEDPYISPNFTPVDYNTISKKYFEDVVLNSSLPNTFYQNEVYIIKGELTGSTQSKATILIDPSDNDPLNYDLYAGTVENNEFAIPVHFRTSGNYNIGIIPGETGNTKLTPISVLPSIPQITSEESISDSLSSIKADYSQDQTYITFNGDNNLLKRLTIEQGNNSVTYLSRQNDNKIIVNYSDFTNFDEGDVTYFLEEAKISSQTPLTRNSKFIKSNSYTINVVEHSFDSILADEINASPPDKISSKKNKISFIGTLKVATQNIGYITKPDGFVDTIELSTSKGTETYYGTEIIPQNSDVQFEYQPSTNGRHIIEIIDKNGLPIINHPVYVGNVLPLIPDFFDLNMRSFFSKTFNLDSLREELLKGINESRKAQGLSSVSLNEDLNGISQSHSNDMVENNFFGHINTQNQSPDERRIAAGIKTPVSENIARDVSIQFAHFGLMRSGSHRQNILNSAWTSVGLGIAEKDGYLYITEEFSTSAVDPNDLASFKSELLTEINNTRNEKGVTTLSYNDDLESACAYLNEKTIQEKVTLTNEDLSTALNLYNIDGTALYIGRTYNIWQEILTSIIEQEVQTISESSWKKIGIDIQLDEIGNIHTTFMINK